MLHSFHPAALPVSSVCLPACLIGTYLSDERGNPPPFVTLPMPVPTAVHSSPPSPLKHPQHYACPEPSAVGGGCC
ncbi:predicted protein [Plenodomus lingam JN3]|uniref:Predicted protein n=1 Tax=Leptosphaeria maculans (strain JN3 / isolate v23.1.3 / race Av1-4-5-6-7-8) TaxID=985895 RepID=E4ZV98_LEPMJ|nr:predicted protein [Plenodomus lingam JN3]CBX95524.1 predicted protein [Plenodomus lingam JN3]